MVDNEVLTEEHPFGIEPETYSELETNHPKLYKNIESGTSTVPTGNPFDGGNSGGDGKGVEFVRLTMVFDGLSERLTEQYPAASGGEVYFGGYTPGSFWSPELGSYMWESQFVSSDTTNTLDIYVPKDSFGQFRVYWNEESVDLVPMFVMSISVYGSGGSKIETSFKLKIKSWDSGLEVSDVGTSGSRLAFIRSDTEIHFEIDIDI